MGVLVRIWGLEAVDSQHEWMVQGREGSRVLLSESWLVDDAAESQLDQVAQGMVEEKGPSVWVDFDDVTEYAIQGKNERMARILRRRWADGQ